MSLINDALKKAARQRAQEEATVVAPMPGGGSSRARAGGKQQNLLLVIAAAVGVAVVSAVLTGMYIAGRPSPKPEGVAAAAPKPAPVQPAPVQPAVEAPAIRLPSLSVAAPTQAPVQVAAAHAEVAQAPAARAPVVASPTPAHPAIVIAAEPAPETANAKPAAATAQPSLAERAQAFIDTLHVAGVRYSSTGSKALIDGHVYRLNDTVERTLGIRLVKIDEDHLTFSDPAGGSYVKTF